MLDDRGIQSLLEKYRPAEPPAELQLSIHQLTNSIHQLTNPPIHQLTWPWVVAAAALFVVAVVLHGTATAPTLQSPTPTAAQLADFFGGGPAAAATAEFILASPLIASGHDDLAPVIPQ